MKSFATALLLFVSLFGFSQTHQNGLIIPSNFSSDSFNDYCCVFAPEKGFNLYDRPNGNLIGKILQRSKGEFELDDMFVIKLLNGNTPLYKKFNKGLIEVGYDVFVMSFFRSNNGYVKVFDKKLNYWLKISEIEKAGFKVSNWQDFLIENSAKLLGYYANKPGLNLRELPSRDGRVLKTLRGDLFEIQLMPERQGNWNKVKVLKYQEHPCKGNLTKEENLEYILNGWIKTVDDNGKPNVWYYPKGC